MYGRTSYMPQMAESVLCQINNHNNLAEIVEPKMVDMCLMCQILQKLKQRVETKMCQKWES